MANRCLNPDCERDVCSGAYDGNKTQDEYCSRYCNLYVSQGLTKEIKPDSLGRRNRVMPVIEVHCDVCGGAVMLEYRKLSDGNRSFCSQACHFELKGRRKRAELWLTVLRVLRDHPRKIWSVSELASWLDNTLHRHTVTSASVSNMLRMMKPAVEKMSAGVYQFRDEARGKPLINYIPKRR